MTEQRVVYPDLRNRIVAVTGGASGIGKAIVESFHRQNSRVVFFDVDADAGRDLANRLGNRVHFHHLDLTDINALKSAFHEAARTHGNMQILINNAANDDRHALLDVTADYWRQRMAVNLDHVFFASQAVVPGMLERGKGSIVNMSSIAWQIGLENAPAYVSAKAAVQGLTHAMARELGPGGIRVNCVLPGAVLTQRQLDNWLPEEVQQEVIGKQCLKRMIEPDDVAAMVLMLASDVSRAVTNQTLTVDAGWT